MPTMPLNVTVNVVGDQYMLSWNGIVQATYTDNNAATALTSGSVGIFVNDATAVTVDNFVVNFDRMHTRLHAVPLL
jgi:hypothetical protein